MRFWFVRVVFSSWGLVLVVCVCGCFFFLGFFLCGFLRAV